MSNRSRGNAFENRIKEFLELNDYRVDKARATLKMAGPGRFYSSPNDFFGCADLMAVRDLADWTLFIQATIGDPSPRKRKMEAVPWNLRVQRVQIWERRGKPGWIRIHEMNRSLEAGISWPYRDFRPGFSPVTGIL